MHRIAEEEEWLLGGSLKEFQNSHPDLSVEPRAFNISSCFLGKDGRVQVPNYWYNGKKEPVVMAYVVRGGPMIRKSDVKRPVIEEGEIKRYQQIPFRYTTDFRVLSMLCGQATRNIAMSEFLDFKWESLNPAGISTLDKRILKIEDTTRMHCRGNFNPLTDNAFIFCRESAEEAENAARLNALWIDMIGELGNIFIQEPPFPYEVELAKKVLPKDFFSDPSEDVIKRESYQHGRKAHTVESEWFMAKIAERYAGEMKRASHDILYSQEVDEILDIVKSSGEDGADVQGFVYRGVEKYDADRCWQILEGIFSADSIISRDCVRCVIQEPPKEYLDRGTRELLSECYPRYPQRPYFRIYNRSVVEKMLREGKVVEAFGFGVPQLPHYVLVEQAPE